jgi:hypothetical protein
VAQACRKLVLLSGSYTGVMLLSPSCRKELFGGEVVY